MLAAQLALAPVQAVGRPACVVDFRLCLFRYGLLAVRRLTSQFDVWLPGEVREILREPRSYRLRADQLLPRASGDARGVDPDAEVAEAQQELGLWDRRPEDADLAAMRLHYVGDRADECHLPAGLDRGVQKRFEQLRQGLQILADRSLYDRGRGDTVAACVRDAVALCAALQPYGAFVLTRLEPDRREDPALCTYLDAWGVRTTRVPRRGGNAAMPLRHALAQAGLGPLAWAGVGLVAIHVITPGLSVLGGPDGALDEEAIAGQWALAEAFWHRVF